MPVKSISGRYMPLRAIPLGILKPHDINMSQMLSTDEILGWKRDGFLVRDEFAAPEHVELLRQAYDEVLQGDAVGDRMLGGITRQVMVPSMSHPVFDDNPLLELGKQ